MPNRVRVLMVPGTDRAELERRTRSKGVPARMAERARIVLLAAEGLTGAEIAGRTGCTEPTVIKWRRQYAQSGLAGLEDAPRGGGPVTVLTEQTVCEILAATVTPPPESLQKQGITHWSPRRLADWLGRSRKIPVSHDSVTRVWRRFCLRPHRSEGFTFSTVPELDATVRDVVGLYLNPPENAVVVCVDEKSQCQALERTQPILPLRPDIPERQTHDYARHGVTRLFAALTAATGRVTDACYPRHRHQEFLAFLKKTAAACPGVTLHVVLDNYASHRHQDVRTWLARPENHPRPFAWTKDADEILASTNSRRSAPACAGSSQRTLSRQCRRRALISGLASRYGQNGCPNTCAHVGSPVRTVCTRAVNARSIRPPNPPRFSHLRIPAG
jgi:transposase